MVEIMIRKEIRKKIRKKRFRRLDWAEKFIIALMITLVCIMFFFEFIVPKALEGPDKAKAKIGAQIDAKEKSKTVKITDSKDKPKPPDGENGGKK